MQTFDSHVNAARHSGLSAFRVSRWRQVTPTAVDAFKPVVGYNSLIAGTDLITSGGVSLGRP